jgi:hypothetical protein
MFARLPDLVSESRLQLQCFLGIGLERYIFHQFSIFLTHDLFLIFLIFICNLLGRVRDCVWGAYLRVSIIILLLEDQKQVKL